MIALLAIFLAQVGLPFSMVAGGATATPTPTPSVTPTPTPIPGTVVATPAITPTSGVDTPVTVSITCATAGATIFYTLSAGGTNPTHSGGTPLGSTRIYAGSFSSGTGVKEVRALGYKAGMTDSAIAINNYNSGQGGGQ